MIDNITDELTKDIIKDHINGNLGEINIKEYILNKYPNLNDIEIITLIYNIGNELAKDGYEIKINIDKFDIVNFNTDEYKQYLYELKKLELNNKIQLEKEAKILTKDLLKLYDNKKNLKDILKILFKNKNYSQKEENFLRIHIINNLTTMGYYIENIEPLQLKKI